jgi:cellulose synthase/poly-beta-1,6-N-acetylglucosamine synthase-like glycosyltransferase
MIIKTTGKPVHIMNLLSVLRCLSYALAVITSVCYLYQIVYLILPLIKKQRPLQTRERRRYAILIAARNEEAVLPHLLESIRLQDYPAELITTYVVADNCTDRTAVVAEQGGAQVFRRFSATEIGKGYALNYLLKKIDETAGLDSYDAFLIFDADNLLLPDYVTQINKVCSNGFDAFCGYRNSKNFGANWISQGYALWYLHDSCHLNQSRMLLGTTCAVNGTGFGFTRQLLRRMGGWNFFTLTEDIEFSTWCATRGIRIGYCRDAMVFDEQPENFIQSWRQRTRWTQGGLQVSIRYAKDLFKGLFKGGRIAYASFETATLSLWGYGMGVICCGITLLVTFLAERWLGLSKAILLGIAGTYGSMFLMGALTLLTEWGRIRATTGEKIKALFAFPLFMMTFIPIALTAVFRKFQWQPIAHTVAISAGDLQKH